MAESVPSDSEADEDVDNLSKRNVMISECKLCQRNFNFVNLLPYILECGDTICFDCLPECIDEECPVCGRQPSASGWNCPLDRQLIELELKMALDSHQTLLEFSNLQKDNMKQLEDVEFRIAVLIQTMTFKTKKHSPNLTCLADKLGKYKEIQYLGIEDMDLLRPNILIQCIDLYKQIFNTKDSVKDILQMNVQALPDMTAAYRQQNKIITFSGHKISFEIILSLMDKASLFVGYKVTDQSISYTRMEKHYRKVMIPAFKQGIEFSETSGSIFQHEWFKNRRPSLQVYLDISIGGLKGNHSTFLKKEDIGSEIRVFINIDASLMESNDFAKLFFVLCTGEVEFVTFTGSTILRKDRYIDICPTNIPSSYVNNVVKKIPSFGHGVDPLTSHVFAYRCPERLGNFGIVTGVIDFNVLMKDVDAVPIGHVVGGQKTLNCPITFGEVLETGYCLVE